MRRIIKWIRELLNSLLGYTGDVNVVAPDMHLPVDTERETIALDQFRKEVKRISALQCISQRLAICKLMAMEEVNYKDRSEVEKFFWHKGVSQENIQTLTDDFYRLQHQKFRGRSGNTDHV